MHLKIWAFLLIICLLAFPFGCAEAKDNGKAAADKKVEKVSAAIADLLKKENCTLVVTAITTTAGTDFKIQVVPVPEQKKPEVKQEKKQEKKK